MQKKITLRLSPADSMDDERIKHHLASELGININEISGYQLLKKSLDARGRQVWFHLTMNVFINEPIQIDTISPLQLQDVSKAHHSIIVVGAGPAGLFAALRLIMHGIKPIILERGKDVRARRRDLAAMNKEGVVNPDSNYCFGEGGAGTYSDGKLYTRSTKRGDVQRILNILVHFGADPNILYDAHPHIGTNKLPYIITVITKAIRDSGGEVYFEKKLVDFTIKNELITEVKTADGDQIETDGLILATGHSARDIYELLYQKKIEILFKPFALGVRIEHPQSLIDRAQYHLTPAAGRVEGLPPASYSLVEQVNGKGVFSFCMCPGGIIAPAATNSGEIVVNGWSPSKRNNPFANSGIVVNVDEKDIQGYKKHGALAGIYFQQSVEQRAYEAGGGKLIAPAQRLVDFTKQVTSASVPICSYLPGIASVHLKDVLPGFVHGSLLIAFKEFGKKIKGYFTNEAVLVATESRTSSPVRIPRDEKKLHHPQVKNLYPCAEGAGYAGGIVSAAMDGEKIANQLASTLHK